MPKCDKARKELSVAITMERKDKIKQIAKRLQYSEKPNASLLVIWIAAELYKLRSNLLEFYIVATL
jgi:hypothetical protein